jgi:hypothetical protein
MKEPIQKYWEKRQKVLSIVPRLPGLTYYILDENHELVPTKNVLVWARWFEKARLDGSNIVGKTKIGDVEVSTVFLGINHNFFGDTPQVFETMVFGGAWDQYQWRCLTWDEAEQQHEDACDAVRRRTPPKDDEE